MPKSLDEPGRIFLAQFGKVKRAKNSAIMEIFNKMIDTWMMPATANNLPWLGTPEIKFEVYFEQTVVPGDRIKMGMAKQPDGQTKEIYYEITSIVSREQSTAHYTNDIITANAKRITV